MNVLFVKLGAIGDVIHTLPALAAVRTSFPAARITWAAASRPSAILQNNPMIDDLIEVDTDKLRPKGSEDLLKELTRQIRTVRQIEVDTAIDFQGLLKSALVTRVSGARRRWGFSRADLREPAARVFYTDVLRVPPQTHVVTRNIMLAAAALDFVPVEGAIEFPIATDNADKAEAERIANRAGRKFAVLNPAGGWTTKLWGAENYGRLADRIREELDMSSVVVVGPNEVMLADQAAAAARSDSLIIAQPSLKGFYELAKLAAIYVGGDTGPTHLAIAAGTPVVGIFGPTEWWRNGSLRPDDICVERLDIGCRVDCHRRTCSNWICMDIDVELVVEAVRGRLGRIPNIAGLPV
ncbi:MAG: glycosyltransferase family 9 protein [Acidobacteriota bacterium]